MRLGHFCSALLLLSPACAGPGHLSRGSVDGWTEAQSTHFRVLTDLSVGDAEEAARTLEKTRAALLAVIWPNGQIPQEDKVTAVVFAERGDFTRLFTYRYHGLAATWEAEQRLFLSGPPRNWEVKPEGGFTDVDQEGSSSLVRHELTHYLSSYFYLRQPRWFSEGLASYLATVSLDPEKGVARVGLMDEHQLWTYRGARYVRVKDILAWAHGLDDAQTMGEMYACSWMFVHWLFGTHPQELDAFRRALGRGVPPARAWAEAFPGFDTVKGDGELTRYLGHMEVFEYPIKVQPSDIDVRTRPMTAVEVHAMRAKNAFVASLFLAGQTKPLQQVVRAELDEVARIDLFSTLRRSILRRSTPRHLRE